MKCNISRCFLILTNLNIYGWLIGSALGCSSNENHNCTFIKPQKYFLKQKLNNVQHTKIRDILTSAYIYGELV